MTRKINHWLILICLLIFTACGEKMKQSEELALLLETDRNFASISLKLGYAEAFNRYLADDALELGDQANPVTGRETIYQRMKRTGDKYTLSWEPQNGEVANSGELGYTWGFYILSWTDDDGSDQKNYGKYLNIWKKSDAKNWKVIVDIGNSSPEPQE